MSNPKDIMGMEAHLDGDTFLKRLDDREMDYLREYMEWLIAKKFGKKPSETAVDLAVECYAQGVDDVGGALVVLHKFARARRN